MIQIRNNDSFNNLSLGRVSFLNKNLKKYYEHKQWCHLEGNGMEKAVVVKVDDKTAKLIETYHMDVELAVKLLLCRSQCRIRAKGQCPLEVRD